MSQRAIRLLACFSLVIMLIVACGERKETRLEKNTADGLVLNAYKQKDYPLLLALADSLEKIGALSPVKSYYWRGYASDHMGKKRAAEYYWKKSGSSITDFKNPEEVEYYAKSASRLANLKCVKGDYEGTLQFAIPVVEKLEELHCDTTSDYINLLIFIGCGQSRFANLGEGNTNIFERAYTKHLEHLKNNPSQDEYKSAIAGIVNIAYNCLTIHQYEKTVYWCKRYEELLDKYEQLPGASSSYLDKQRARQNIYSATALANLDQELDAYIAYSEFKKTEFSKSIEGIYDEGEYLIDTEKWSEAADCFQHLNKLLDLYHMEFTFDNIQNFLLKKYEANRMAGRKDTVYAVSTYICDSLSAAIDRYKHEDAAELATIYDTQKKESKIAEQKASMLRERQLAALITIILISAFFIAYMLYKHKSTIKLTKAHEELKEAYNQLEETTSAKEKIESELRIARHIQESIVPNEFPQRDDFELYASMTPAKEVGGDLYDYLIIGDYLHFCVGDVSGKGVPSALFMAQAIRLFRAMAKRGYTPVKIATELNAELVEHNDDGMFVTMFIGMVHLPTGKLDFCNAGHNPPVLGNGNESKFIPMESNAPIGLWEGLQFTGEVIEDIRGRLLFVYTDGLNEAENPQQVQFGDEKLLDIVKRTSQMSPRDVIKTMKSEVKHHRNGADPNDDLSMLCLRIK
ncbi:PP2C family protein-serine/threonine phosphatase [Xylanibacter ruminicola]|uniref:Serine phosphatase RsbU, regulator of sigma subunit n=1 Tax=Xylanibacter ruminicola TaxID=839 RepID=A0A1M6SZF2_XYLRU|nr:PP2C family protein-serine/threonine phosphatase [Xylanibacter ruminicola]SHK50123.1 Serine phosphatase RsbU, regulator of sigma subunit [Xylanibacter ruminicola]